MLARETGGVHDVAHKGMVEWVPPPIQGGYRFWTRDDLALTAGPEPPGCLAQPPDLEGPRSPGPAGAGPALRRPGPGRPLRRRWLTVPMRRVHGDD
jgi:hypothetical protein